MIRLKNTLYNEEDVSPAEFLRLVAGGVSIKRVRILPPRLGDASADFGKLRVEYEVGHRVVVHR